MTHSKNVLFTSMARNRRRLGNKCTPPPNLASYAKIGAASGSSVPDLGSLRFINAKLVELTVLLHTRERDPLLLQFESIPDLRSHTGAHIPVQRSYSQTISAAIRTVRSLDRDPLYLSASFVSKKPSKRINKRRQLLSLAKAPQH